MRLVNADVLIAGVQIDTDEIGVAYCPSKEFLAQYAADASFRSYFEEELEGYYLHSDGLSYCEAGEHYVPDADMRAVQVRAATHLSPAEHDGVCVWCVERADESEAAS